MHYVAQTEYKVLKNTLKTYHAETLSCCLSEAFQIVCIHNSINFDKSLNSTGSNASAGRSWTCFSLTVVPLSWPPENDLIQTFQTWNYHLFWWWLGEPWMYLSGLMSGFWYFFFLFLKDMTFKYCSSTVDHFFTSFVLKCFLRTHCKPYPDICCQLIALCELPCKNTIIHQTHTMYSSQTVLCKLLCFWLKCQ